MMQKLMVIKKHPAIVIGIAVLISAGIWIRALVRPKAAIKGTITNKIFEGPKGWGYNILVNDSIIIHQEFIPVISSHTGFPKKEEAQKAADMVIGKISKGGFPSITEPELQQILSPEELANAK